MKRINVPRVADPVGHVIDPRLIMNSEIPIGALWLLPFAICLIPTQCFKSNLRKYLMQATQITLEYFTHIFVVGVADDADISGIAGVD